MVRTLVALALLAPMQARAQCDVGDAATWDVTW
jgi:hypothetical protein